MAVTTTIYNNARYLVGTGDIDISADTFKAILVDTDYTLDVNNHTVLSEVTANQLDTGNGYTQDDKVLPSGTFAIDTGTNRAVLAFTDISWIADGGSIGPTKGMIIYDDTVTDDPLIAYIDFGTTYTVVDGGGLQPEDVKILI